MTYDKLSKKGKQIYDRYQRGGVRDDQLIRYYELGAISKEEYDFIYESKHPKTTTETVEDLLDKDPE